MAYLTGNPLNSTDPRDSSDNKEFFDEMCNSPSSTYTDRFGTIRKTITGIQQDLSGYVSRGLWATGQNYLVNEIWQNGSGGEYYQVLSAYTSGASAAADIAGGNVALFQARLASDADVLAGTSGKVPDAAQVRDRYAITVTSVAEAAALTGMTAGQSVNLVAGGRSGLFDVVAGDFATQIAADEYNGIYIAMADDPTGANKCLVRRYEKLYAEFFGFVSNLGSGSDQSAAMQAAIDWSRNNGYVDIWFSPNGGTSYFNVTIPDVNLSLRSEGGRCNDYLLAGGTAVYPYDSSLPAIEVKPDATAIALRGYDFVVNNHLSGFTVIRGSVPTTNGPLVKLWRWRRSDLDINLFGDGGIGLQIINLFEDNFNTPQIDGFDVGLDITDGPQSDSVELNNVLIQYNKIGCIIGRLRTSAEPVTPDQNGSINSLKISGKVIGRFGGGSFISGGNSSHFETSVSADSTDSTTVSVTDGTGFISGEPVVFGASNSLQYGFVVSQTATTVTLDRAVTVTAGWVALQGKIGVIACHVRNMSMPDMQLEAHDFGVICQNMDGALMIGSLALSSVVKPIVANGTVRYINIESAIGGTDGTADWKLITVTADDSNALGVSLANAFLNGSGYYTYNSNPSVTANNYIDVRSTAKPVLYHYSDYRVGDSFLVNGNAGSSAKTVRGGATNDVVDRYYSSGRDFVREFYDTNDDDAIRETYDVSAQRLITTTSGDSAPYIILNIGDPTITNDADRYVQIGGGTWNNKPLRLGSYYLWVDTTGSLRIKSSAPTSATDGTVVGTQT